MIFAAVDTEELLVFARFVFHPNIWWSYYSSCQAQRAFEQWCIGSESCDLEESLVDSLSKSQRLFRLTSLYTVCDSAPAPSPYHKLSFVCCTVV